MLTRRALFAMVPVAGALSASYAFGVEPRWLEAVVQPVWIPGLRGSLRVLHLSDLHASFEVPFSLIDAAVELGLQHKPDIICLTGDFITRPEPLDWEVYAKILRRLSSAAPTFATLGNHDGNHNYSAVLPLLRDSGITLLHNVGQTITTAHASMNIVGLGDLWQREVRAATAFANLTDRPTLLLAHNPDTKDSLDFHPWDLMLSGHTHGGQVLVPLVGERYAPVEDKRYIAGLKPWGNRQIYVTRGVGSLCGVRFNCRPEVTILDLQG